MMKYGPYADLPVAVKIFSLYSHRRRKRKKGQKRKKEINPTRRKTKRKEINKTDSSNPRPLYEAFRFTLVVMIIIMSNLLRHTPNLSLASYFALLPHLRAVLRC